VPPKVIVPEASGVRASGWTAIPEKATVPAAVVCVVTEQVTVVLVGAEQVPARPLVPALIVGVDDELKENPLGAARVIEPVAMSPAWVTAIDGPASDVQAGLGAFAAVSAEIAPPPVAGVAVVAAWTGATNGASDPAPISPVRSPAISAGRRRREGDAVMTDPPGVRRTGRRLTPASGQRCPLGGSVGRRGP